MDTHDFCYMKPTASAWGFSSGPVHNVFYDEWLCRQPLTKGDRVRIKEGYEDAGLVFEFIGKSINFDDQYRLRNRHGVEFDILAAAIEPYPYTREERIERAIEDYAHEVGRVYPMSAQTFTEQNAVRCILYAILDAGI